MSATRKLRRVKKKQSEKDMQEKLGLFDKLPDHCLTCLTPYDKLNKEHVTMWKVVVREKEGKVNLYCPDCWTKATNLVKQMERELGE
jgi:hypothetical protein